eukprot:403349507
MSDLRFGLWNLDRKKEFFKKQMSDSHGQYFNKLMNEKRAASYDQFKDKLDASDDQDRKHRLSKLNSGYKEMIENRNKNRESQVQAMEESNMRKKLNLYVRSYVQPNKKEEFNKSGINIGGAIGGISQKISQNIALKIQESIDTQKVEQQKQLEKLKLIQHHKMIHTLVQKFKAEVQKSFGSQNLGGSPRTYTDPQKLKITKEEWFKMLMLTDLQYMSYQCFKILLANEEVMLPIARELKSVHGDGKFDRQDLDDVLKQSDKDLFVQFRDKHITFDQLKARVAERQGLAKYMVYDDIKDQLHPSITQNLDKYDQTMKLLFKGKDKIEVKDLLRPFEPWEVNPRCLKSIQYAHKKRLKPTQASYQSTCKEINDLMIQKSQNPEEIKSDQPKESSNKQLDKISLSKSVDNLAVKIQESTVQNPKISKSFQTTQKNEKPQKNMGFRLINQYKSLHNQHQKYVQKSTAYYSSKLKDKQKVFHSRTDYSFYQDQQNSQIDKQEESLLKNKSLSKIIKDQSNKVDQEMSKERLAVLQRELQAKEFQDRKKSLLFIKQLEQGGVNLQLDQSHKRLLDINDDLEVAIQQDLMSDSDDEQKTGDQTTQKIVLNESERRLKQLKQLKSSFALAKNVKLQQLTSENQYGDKIQRLIMKLKKKVKQNTSRSKSGQFYARNESNQEFQNQNNISESFQGFVNYYGIPIAKQDPRYYTNLNNTATSQIKVVDTIFQILPKAKSLINHIFELLIPEISTN